MKLNAMRLALAVACLGLLVPAANAEYYTSFEASEGYLDGNINGQLDWAVTGGAMNVYTTAGGFTGTGRGEIAINTFVDVSGDAVSGGDAYFTIYYNTSGRRGIQLFVGDEDMLDTHMAVYIYSRNTGGVLKYQDGSEIKSGPTPPSTGWWAIRTDFHWNAETSRYTSWDFKYKAVASDADWTTVESGLEFKSQDALGYNYDLAAVMPWNRPTSSDTPKGIMLVDDIFLGLVPEPATLSLLLAGGLFGLFALGLRGKRG